MPSFCSVVYCSNNAMRDNVRFFRIPKMLAFPFKKHLNELSALRRKKWISAINRADLTETKLKYARVCSKHFVTGEPAKLEDTSNPDWVPSLNMGYNPHRCSKRKMSRKKVEGHHRFRKVINEDVPYDVYNVPSTQLCRICEKKTNGSIKCIKCKGSFHSRCVMRVPGYRVVGCDELICANCNNYQQRSIDEKLAFYYKNNTLLSTLVNELRETNILLRGKVFALEEKLMEKSTSTHILRRPEASICKSVVKHSDKGFDEQKQKRACDSASVISKSLMNMHPMTACKHTKQKSNGNIPNSVQTVVKSIKPKGSHQKVESQESNPQTTNMEIENVNQEYDEIENVKHSGKEFEKQKRACDNASVISKSLKNMHPVTARKHAKQKSNGNIPYSVQTVVKSIKTKDSPQKVESQESNPQITNMGSESVKEEYDEIENLELDQNTAYLFLTGFDPSVTPEEIDNYIKSITDDM